LPESKASFLPVLRAFEERGVAYVVVGGLATVLHGHPRLTGDVDLVVRLDQENARAAVEALTGMGMKPRAPVDPIGFADEATRRAWMEQKGMVAFSLVDPKNPLFGVDLLTDYPVDFEELFRESVVMRVSGVAVRVCSLKHLIEMKRATGRPIDASDVAALEGLLGDE